MTAALLLPALLALSPASPWIEGQVLVKLAPGAELPLDAAGPTAPVRSVRRALPAPRGLDRVGLARIRVLEVEPGREDALVAALAGAPGIEWAERNAAGAGLTQLVPADTHYALQWSLDQTSDVDMDVPEAWALRGGFGADPTLVVAVVDSGFPLDTTEVDFAGTAWVNAGEVANGLDDDGNGFVDDLGGYDFVEDEADPDGGHPHGYNVASIIAAHTDNGVGIAGLAPGVKLMHVRSFDDDGEFPASGPYAGTLSAAAGLEYAVDNGADLVNNSWTVGTGFSQVVDDAIQYALDNGVHLVFGAANDDAPSAYPGEREGIVAVAGIDSDGVKSSFSNYGAWIDVCAGGTFVPALDPDLGAVYFAGTSASSPLVAGVAAMLLSEDRDLSTGDLRAVLREGAVDVDALNPLHAGLLGSGHANALASLELLEPVEDLGSALAGDFAPLLNAWGGTLAGETLTFSVSGAAPTSLGVLVFGFSRVDLPFLSGTLVPAADVVRLFATDAGGAHARTVALPADLGTGATFWVQALVFDAGAPEGWALTNASSVTGE